MGGIYEIMAMKSDKTKDRRNSDSISANARELFREWEKEEKSGYEGEISWEKFKSEINRGRPSHNKPFQENSE